MASAYATYSEMKRQERAQLEKQKSIPATTSSPNSVYKYDSRTGDIEMSSSTQAPSKPNPSTGSYASSGISSGSSSGGSTGSYMDYLDRMISSSRDSAASLRAEQQRRANEAAAASSGRLNTNADQRLGDASAGYERAMFLLPQQAALMGQGGLTESQLLRLNTNYGNTRNAIEDTRAAGLADIEGQRLQGLSASEQAYLTQMGNIDTSYAGYALPYIQQQEALRRQAAQQASVQPRYNYQTDPAFAQYANEVANGNTQIINNPARLAQLFGEDWVAVYNQLVRMAPAQNQTVFNDGGNQGLLG